MSTDEEATFEIIFGRVCSQLKSAGEVESTSKVFASLTDDTERFNFVQPLLDDFDLRTDGSKGTEKSEIKSCNFREAGNEKFRKKQDLEALKLYTRSILFAPPYSKILALGYGNRSAVLKSLNKYQDCILDIDRAIRLDFPENLLYKLLIRQGDCFRAIGNFEEAEKRFLKAIEKIKISELNEEKSKEQMKMLSNLIAKCKESKKVISKESHTVAADFPCKTYGQNDEITCASNCIKIEYSAEFGRHVCASRDIEPGDTIIVEEPFASVLLPEFFLSHCSFCLQRCTSLIPCSACTHVMFCGENCLEAALVKFHKLECQSMSSILRLDMGKMSLLAVRVLSNAGLDYLSRFLSSAATAILPSTDEQKRTLGFDLSGHYNSQDFPPIFHLISNSEMRSVSDLFKRSLMAVCLIKCLGLDTHADGSLYGSLLLRLLQNLPCNAHEVSETISVKSKGVDSVEIGAAAYACLSLLNHSCDPNVVRHSHGTTAVLRAIKFVPTGTQILDNYGYHFAVHPKEMRQQHLQSQYLFGCRCQACAENWSLHQNLPAAPPIKKISQTIVQESSKDMQDVIQKSLKGDDISESHLENISRHLKLLDVTGGRLCQEFNCCQEIMKQFFARKGNFYS